MGIINIIILATVKWIHKGNQRLAIGEREIKIIESLISGQTCKEVAKTVHLTHRGVENRIYRMKKFFNVRTTAELVLVAYIKKLIDYQIADTGTYIKRLSGMRIAI